jgi:hypothetical protein
VAAAVPTCATDIAEDIPKFWVRAPAPEGIHDTLRRASAKSSFAIQLPPVKHLVGVHIMSSRRPRHRSACHQRLLDDLPPFLHAPPPVLVTQCPARLIRQVELIHRSHSPLCVWIFLLPRLAEFFAQSVGLTLPFPERTWLVRASSHQVFEILRSENERKTYENHSGRW